jgi:hypothetical protein
VGSSSTGSFTDGSYDDDDDLGSSEGEEDLYDAGFDDPRRLHDPIALGVEGVQIPPRLEVLEDRTGYWASGRGTVAKYNGKPCATGGSTATVSADRLGVTFKDPLWLALWLFSVVGVLIGLCFVWGATDVSSSLVHTKDSVHAYLTISWHVPRSQRRYQCLRCLNLLADIGPHSQPCFI